MIKEIFNYLRIEKKLNFSGCNKLEIERALGVIDLAKADLRNADLRGTDLHSARLVWANLTESNLQGADLRYANLQWAKLDGANLSEANLKNCENVTVSQLANAIVDGSTILPNGITMQDIINARSQKGNNIVFFPSRTHDLN